MGLDQVNELKVLDAELAKDSMKGLWVREERMNRKPATRRALCEMLTESESPFDGKCLEYRNPVTGGSTFPTFSCWIQSLDGNKTTEEHRHTSNQLYYAVEGSGVTEVEGEKLEWETGDFFVVPNWSWHKHKNASASEPAILFSTTDRPLHEAIGVYREESR